MLAGSCFFHFPRWPFIYSPSPILLACCRWAVFHTVQFHPLSHSRTKSTSHITLNSVTEGEKESKVLILVAHLGVLALDELA